MKPVFFPAIRGYFGDWIYYTSVMPIRELAKRVSYVKEVHKLTSLSELLQRSITPKREKEISEYLSNNNQRFFNSLVLAVYDSQPNWYPANVLSSRISSAEEIKGDVGLLEFNGTEKIIPIDGQHRYAGIRVLLEKYDNGDIKPDLDFPFTHDIVPVIFISHKRDTEKNRLRTRRLFTTLNKYAAKVNRYEIISLDEDDPMAITTRWLVENDNRFSEGRIKIKGGANISIDDSCLTSIENIYDVLTILFTKVYQNVARRALTTSRRPSDSELLKYRKFALSFFGCLENNYKGIQKYFSLSKYAAYAQSQRSKGNVLFRPVGLKLIANLISKFDDISMEDRFSRIKPIPINLNELPYRGLLIAEHGKMQDGNEVKVRNILLSALGVELNSIEKKSARSGLSIINNVPQSHITNLNLPNCIDDLSGLDKIHKTN